MEHFMAFSHHMMSPAHVFFRVAELVSAFSPTFPSLPGTSSSRCRTAARVCGRGFCTWTALFSWKSHDENGWFVGIPHDVGHLKMDGSVFCFFRSFFPLGRLGSRTSFFRISQCKKPGWNPNEEQAMDGEAPENHKGSWVWNFDNSWF